MIVVNLKGGLGNQMFQYAVGRALSLRLETSLKLDLDFLLARPANASHVMRDYELDIFRLNPQFATLKDKNKYICPYSKNPRLALWRLRRKLFNYIYFEEKAFSFDKNVLNLKGNIYLNGYWQSAKYFAGAESEIRNDFIFREAMSLKANEVLETICNVNSVCLNVRRTDFVTSDFHGVCDAAYFQKANEILRQRISGYHYFVFSDDIEWCVENLAFEVPITFVSHEYAGKKFQDYLRLMSACKHFVIPNSSFAWWAVWFNHNEDRIVIAPKKWFNNPEIDTSDLIPDRWVRI